MRSLQLPHPLISLTFLLAFAVLYFSIGTPYADPDTLWHIASGELILESRSIPLHDPWSFTPGDYIWYDISWLWDAITALMNRYFGPESLFALAIILQAATLAVMCGGLLARGGLHHDPIKIAIFICGFCLWEFTTPRPHLVSFLMLAIYHRVMTTSRNKEDTRQLYVLLPLLMVIWVNMHGGFLAVGLLYAAHLAEAWFKKDRAWFRRLFISGVLCFLALFINPFGWHIFEATLRSLDTVIAEYVFEWQPFTYGTLIGSTFLVAAFLMISNPMNPKIPLADKLVAFVPLFLSLGTIRHFPVTAVLIAPYLAGNLNSMMVLKPLKDFSAPVYRRSAALVTLAIVVAMSLPPTVHLLWGEKFAAEQQSDDYSDTIAFLRKNYPGAKFLNHYETGGGLIFYGRGNPKIFVDGRAGTVYPEELMADYLKVIRNEEGGAEVFDKYQLEGMILNKEHVNQEEGYMRRYNLRRVHDGAHANVYVRVGKDDAPDPFSLR